MKELSRPTTDIVKLISDKSLHINVPPDLYEIVRENTNRCFVDPENLSNQVTEATGRTKPALNKDIQKNTSPKEFTRSELEKLRDILKDHDFEHVLDKLDDAYPEVGFKNPDKRIDFRAALKAALMENKENINNGIKEAGLTGNQYYRYLTYGGNITVRSYQILIRSLPSTAYSAWIAELRIQGAKKFGEKAVNTLCPLHISDALRAIAEELDRTDIGQKGFWWDDLQTPIEQLPEKQPEKHLDEETIEDDADHQAETEEKSSGRENDDGADYRNIRMAFVRSFEKNKEQSLYKMTTSKKWLTKSAIYNFVNNRSSMGMINFELLINSLDADSYAFFIKNLTDYSDTNSDNNHKIHYQQLLEYGILLRMKSQKPKLNLLENPSASSKSN